MQMLEVNNLSISFNQYTKGLRQQKLNVISSLDISLKKGEIMAVVGASGSGKSLLAHAILGILPTNSQMSGTIKYKGELLTPERQAKLRGKDIALIPQSVNFLDPLMHVGKQVEASAKKVDKQNAKAIRQSVFERLHLDENVAEMYPYQLSGGMARRVLLATAIASDAELIIADEPTPGLDPGVIEEALKSFRELADKGHTVMFITHDIEAALSIADKIAVFYAGTTVEIAKTKDFNGSGKKLRHPYSKALWQALPQNEFIPREGSQPYPSNLPPGCLYAPRCELATDACLQGQPEMRELREGMVRCIHAT